MKMLKSKKFLQKMIIALVFLIIFNFIYPNYSRAEWTGGGTLFTPIQELLCGIGDGIINVLQSVLLPGSPKAVDKIKLSEAKKMAGIDENTHIENLKNFWWGNSANNTAIAMTLGGIIGLKVEAISFAVGGIWDIFNYFSDKKCIFTIMLYSPATIFANKIPALDVNFINPNVTYEGGEASYEIQGLDDEGNPIVKRIYTPSTTDNDKEKYKGNTAYHLQSSIATWYKALRNLAVVGLLSVLVYMAIRIILSSTASESAKYKENLKDWLIALCILMFMHYFMAIILKSAEMITDIFEDTVVQSGTNTEETIKTDKLMSDFRQKAYMAVDSNGDADGGERFTYTVMYLVLVIYTLIFTWKYLKRLIYLAFLTIISPMVALTYPIDKLNDGNAQAFNYWFKEYFFNVLIQPIHLIIYSILITSASNLVSENGIYALVAIGFMLEAEKIVKAMFGFDKAQGGSFASAVTGGALFGTAANLLKNGASMAAGGNSKSSKGSSGESDSDKVRFNDRNADSDSTKNLSSFISEGIGTVGDNSSDSGINAPTTYNSGIFKGIQKAKNKGNQKNANVGNNANKKVQNNSRAPATKLRQSKSNVNSKLKNSALGVGTKKAITGVKNFNSDLKKSPIGRGAKTLVNTGRKTLRGVGRVTGRFVNKDSVKKVARLAAMGVGAATLGTVGLAAGLASDNDEDILKYTALGLTTGSLVGKGAVGVMEKVPDKASEIRDDFQRGYYGDEYEEKVLNPRLDKEWLKDRDVKDHFIQTYGDDWKEKREQGLQLRKAGITDMKDIDTAIKLADKNGITIDNAADIMNFKKQITQTDLLSNREGVRTSVQSMVGNDPEATEKILKLLEQTYKLRKMGDN